MKKLLFIGNDPMLIEEYKRMNPDHEITMMRSEETVYTDSNFDMILASDREVQPMNLIQLKQKHSASRCFYLISNSLNTSITENKIAACQQHGVTPIHPKQTNSQIVEQIRGEYKKDNSRRNVCAILGTHSQVGVTSVSLNLAKQLASSERTVCILGLNQYNPGSYFISDYTGQTLDELYTQMVDNRLGISPTEIVQATHYDKERKFYFLAGNQDFSKRGYYKSEDIEHLIAIVAEQFDIVLLDTGFSPCNNLTLQGLFNADVKLLVASQQPLSIKMWDQMNRDILKLVGISVDEFMLVVNRYMSDLPMEAPLLQKAMGIPVTATIPDFGVEGVICEMEKTLLLESRDKRIRRKAELSYEQLANAVQERLLGTKSTLVKEKQGIWNRLVS
ncbi:AAA family ATPase [Paenibacillus marinisediminis]